MVIAQEGACAYSLMPRFLTTLEGHVGQDINQICSTKFTSPSENHCAHFVCHVLGIQYGLVCGSMGYKTRGQGATIRVNELYNNLDQTGRWEDRPAVTEGILIFVLRARHMRTNVMPSVPQKHVGIAFRDHVYHYSNTQDKVVRENSVGDFHARFQRAYSGNDISLYFGRFP